MGSDFDEGVYRRTLERERAARAQAERLLEEKSRELYDVNHNLQDALATQRREAFFHQMVLDSVTDGILTIDPDGRILTANPAVSRIFGFRPDQILGRQVSELLGSETTDTQPNADNHFFADFCSARQPVFCVTGRSARGKKLSLELSASRGDFDNCVLVTWIVRDVGFVNAVKRQSSLSQRLEGIGELAAGIAHEINTPIQFIFENTKFVGEAYDTINRLLMAYEANAIDNAKQGPDIDNICSSQQLAFYRSEIPDALVEMKSGAWRIGEIVAAIKEFSHPGSEALVAISLNDLVTTATTVTANTCRYVANVTCELDHSLPKVSCFQGQIAQVMVNLIVNAVDAIMEKNEDASGAIGTISIQTGSDPEYVFFTVSDNGMGIEDTDRDSIFLPFFTTKVIGKGTGQGLAISHTIIVENHDGRIEVESEVGVGSKFTVRLPRR